MHNVNQQPLLLQVRFRTTDTRHTNPAIASTSAISAEPVYQLRSHYRVTGIAEATLLCKFATCQPLPTPICVTPLPDDSPATA